MISRKDFVLLADLLPCDTPENVLNAIIKFFRITNSRFDRDLWMRYFRGECGPRGGKRK